MMPLIQEIDYNNLIETIDVLLEIMIILKVMQQE